MRRCHSASAAAQHQAGPRAFHWAFLISSCFALSCAASPASPVVEPVVTEKTPAEPAVPATPPSVEHSPAPKMSEGADEAEAEPARAATPKAKAEPDPNATRDIVYTVLPEGLKISVAGVKFTVSASATQIAAGWGVKLSVVASAPDGKAHSLSSPKTGPLAFAGSVQRKGQSEADRFGDERQGDGEQSVFGDDVTRFSRTWPASGTRVLGSGDALDLQVALWGLGLEKEDRRPVKQFCHVRMKVDKGKPKAIVEPPASVAGK